MTASLPPSPDIYMYMCVINKTTCTSAVHVGPSQRPGEAAGPAPRQGLAGTRRLGGRAGAFSEAAEPSRTVNSTEDSAPPGSRYFPDPCRHDPVPLGPEQATCGRCRAGRSLCCRGQRLCPAL